MSRLCSFFKCHSVTIFIISCIVLLVIIIIGSLCSCYEEKEIYDAKICNFELYCKKILTNKEYIYCDETITYLPNNCFSECKKLKRIDFKGDILYIDSSAFNGCENVEEINFYGKVQYYSDGAFQKLTKLKRIYFKDLNIIYARTFSNLTNLKSITIEKNLHEVEDGAFFNCSMLKNFSANEINVCWIDKSNVAVVISQNIFVLKSWAFSFCDSIEKVVIHGNVIAIEPHCFSACQSLKEIIYCDSFENFKKIYPSYAIELSSDCLIKTTDSPQGIKVEDSIKKK